MYTAISIDVFIAAFSGAMAGFQSGKVPRATTLPPYVRLSNAALAYAEQFDTTFASPLPNDLQLAEIEEISAEVMAMRYPNNDTTSKLPASYSDAVNGVIAMMSEANAVVAANVTNPIPFPVPPGGVPVIQIATVEGVTDSLLSTTPTAAIAAIVEGYYTRGDGLNIVGYFWNTTDTRAHNGGTVVNPTGHVGPGRWNGLSGTGPIQVGWFGVIADGNIVEDGSMTTASNILTSATAGFTPDDVGKTILIDAVSDPATGTVQFLVDQRPIIGTGTKFLTEYAQQHPLSTGASQPYYNAAGAFLVLSDTLMYMNWPAQGNATGQTIYRQIQQLATITGYISPTQVHTSFTAVALQTGLRFSYGNSQNVRTQVAITAAKAEGRDLEWGPGFYGYSENLSFGSDAHNMKVSGAGMFSTELFMMLPYYDATPMTPNDGFLSFLTGCHDIVLSDMTINYSCPYMPVVNSVTGTMKATFFDACPNCRIEYVNAIRCRDESLYAQADCTNFKFDYCQSKAVGTAINMNVDSLHAMGLSITNCEGSSCAGNALLFGGRSCVVTGNDFHGFDPVNPAFTPSGADCVVSEPAGRIVFSDNNLHDIDVTTAGVGIYKMFGGTDDPSANIAITNNVFTDIAGDFIDAHSAVISMAIEEAGEFSMKGVCNIQGNSFQNVTAPGRVNARYVFVEGPDTGLVNIAGNIFNSPVGSNMTTIVTIDPDVPATAVRLGTNTLSPVVTVQANGNFVVIPIVNQQQVTNNTTGAPTNQLVDVTTGGLADPVKVNNNFASLLAALQASAVVRN